MMSKPEILELIGNAVSAWVSLERLNMAVSLDGAGIILTVNEDGVIQDWLIGATDITHGGIQAQNAADAGAAEVRIDKAFWFGATWMVRRDSDGKVAIAVDSDVSVGTGTAQAVAEDTEDSWFPTAHEAIHDAGIACHVIGCFA